MVAFGLAAMMAGCVHTPPVPDMSAAITSPMLDGKGPQETQVPFTLDNNRVFVEITFLKPDGTERKALASVNMGQAPMYISNALYRELVVDQSRSLRFRIGETEIGVNGTGVQPEGMLQNFSVNFDSSTPTPTQMAETPGGLIEAIFWPMKVEAIIPAGVLEHFEVVWDYGARTLTLAAPGSLKPQGVAVPVRVNPKTGFVSLDVRFDGTEHPFVIDDGGSYTGFRDAKAWRIAHPEWLRVIGGIGAANFSLGGADAALPVMGIPKASFGPLELDAFDGEDMVLPSISSSRLLTNLFWDWYSQKAGEQTSGWIGGNVLKNFRLTINCENRMSYWLAEQPLDIQDLDQVGIVLRVRLANTGVVTIGGIARKYGADTVSSVEIGDRLIMIGDLDASTATPGQLSAALGGKPGDVRHLVLERKGKRLEVDATVTRF